MTKAEGHGRRSAAKQIVPTDPRNPGEEFLAQEIRADRRAERWLVPKAILALALVAVLVAVRELFFA